MLVLSRSPGEQIRIGDDITITIVETVGRRIKIGIAAPDHVRILRGELEPETPRREPGVRPRRPAITTDAPEQPQWRDASTTGRFLAIAARA